MAEEFFIPKLGQTVEEVTIIEWLVADGAEVETGQPILEVETDKAVFPVEANANGYLHIGPYKQGDVVPVLAVVAVIGAAHEHFAVEGTLVDEERPLEAVAGPSPSPSSVGFRQEKAAAPGKLFASPRARRLAKEKKVDLSRVQPTGDLGRRVIEKDVLAYLSQQSKVTPLAQKVAAVAGLPLEGLAGTGPGGRVTRADVEKLLGTGEKPAEAPEETTPPAPPTPAAVPLPLPEMEVLERIPLSGVRGIIAERMGTSVHTTARVTLMMEVDATEFVAMRERIKAKVAEEWGFAPGYNDLLAKIVAVALRKYPHMNARLAADAIEYLAEINIGIAVDTERGLLVPVIHHADQKSLRQFGLELRQLVDRARNRKSLPDDLAGGTFTITNLGAYEIDAFTPVINLPEAAILGVGRIAPKVVPRDGQAVIRTMCTLSLVFDHRLVDGAAAARFLQYIKSLMEEPYLLLSALQE
jgi:pyruvate dehydrogenase E2 component (dihydrolipoamide acetyltransferase)